MIGNMEQSGHTQYGLKGFVIDSEDDLGNLPIVGLAMGSWALVIDTGDVYMLKSNGTWTKLGG